MFIVNIGHNNTISIDIHHGDASAYVWSGTATPAQVMDEIQLSVDGCRRIAICFDDINIERFYRNTIATYLTSPKYRKIAKLVQFGL